MSNFSQDLKNAREKVLHRNIKLYKRHSWEKYAKIQPSVLPSGVETKQPLMAQKYKPKTITIEKPRQRGNIWTIFGSILLLFQTCAQKQVLASYLLPTNAASHPNRPKGHEAQWREAQVTRVQVTQSSSDMMTKQQEQRIPGVHAGSIYPVLGSICSSETCFLLPAKCFGECRDIPRGKLLVAAGNPHSPAAEWACHRQLKPEPQPSRTYQIPNCPDRVSKTVTEKKKFRFS